jgi:protein-S-isoprenylcysteine O-methyltransferase Ste14
MRRTLAVVGSALFFVLAPGTVAGLVPWWLSRWHVESHGTWWLPLRAFGGVLVVAGTLVLVDSFVRFAITGVGTPAPIFPTRHLVVTGLYRYVRNPMYLAVLSVIFGQGLIFANIRVLEYGVLVGLAFHLFVIAYEEPTLRATFGPEYEGFCRRVSRWVPRLRLSTSSGDDSELGGTPK